MDNFNSKHHHNDSQRFLHRLAGLLLLTYQSAFCVLALLSRKCPYLLLYVRRILVARDITVFLSFRKKGSNDAFTLLVPVYNYTYNRVKLWVKKTFFDRQVRWFASTPI